MRVSSALLALLLAACAPFGDSKQAHRYHVLEPKSGKAASLPVRVAGVTAERIIGLLAFWSGVSHSRRPMSAHEFRQQFEIKSLPRHPVTFTSEEHQWLMQGALVPC